MAPGSDLRLFQLLLSQLKKGNGVSFSRSRIADIHEKQDFIHVGHVIT